MSRILRQGPKAGLARFAGRGPLLFALTFACGTPIDGNDAGTDLIDSHQNGEKSFELGTGLGRFEPLTDGQDVEIIRGPQGGGRLGGYHIWHAVRTRGFQPVGMRLEFRTYLVSNLQLIASQARNNDLWQDESGAYLIDGVAPAFDDCCLAEDQDLLLTVSATDSAGLTGRDQRRIHAGLCLGFGDTSICPARH